MNNIARNILLAIATIIPSGNALAQIPDGYYDALKDKKGAELKTAVHNIIKNANVLDYGHVLNFCTSPDKYLSVEAHCDGNVTKLTGFKWPAGNNYASVESGDVSLNQFVGKKIQIVFRYPGTTSVSATWEIQKTTVTGKKTSSGIVAVSSSSQFDSTKPYEVFDMSGHRLSQNEYKHGVVIIRQGGKVFKMVKK